MFPSSTKFIIQRQNKYRKVMNLLPPSYLMERLVSFGTAGVVGGPTTGTTDTVGPEETEAEKRGDESVLYCKAHDSMCQCGLSVFGVYLPLFGLSSPCLLLSIFFDTSRGSRRYQRRRSRRRRGNNGAQVSHRHIEDTYNHFQLKEK